MLPALPTTVPTNVSLLPTIVNGRLLTALDVIRPGTGRFPGLSGMLSDVGEREFGGGSGIRTHVAVSRKHAFQACALSHSAIPPALRGARVHPDPRRIAQFQGAKLAKRPGLRNRRVSRPAARIGTRRSEEHTSELQSLMRISYAVFCLQKQNKKST